MGEPRQQGTPFELPRPPVRLTNAIIADLDAHNAVSTKALESTASQRALKEILLRYSGLYEALRGVQASGKQE